MSRYILLAVFLALCMLAATQVEHRRPDTVVVEVTGLPEEGRVVIRLENHNVGGIDQKQPQVVESVALVDGGRALARFNDLEAGTYDVDVIYQTASAKTNNGGLGTRINSVRFNGSDQSIQLDMMKKGDL